MLPPPPSLSSLHLLVISETAVLLALGLGRKGQGKLGDCSSCEG